MSPERNYKLDRDKMLSAEDLSREDLQKVLNIGLDFISDEIESSPKISSLLGNESSDFQVYFPYVTLVRLVHQYQDAKKENLIKSDSYLLFEKMKKYYSEQLKISDGSENNSSFEDKIVNTICCELDLFDEEKYIESIGNNMPRIARWAAEIVPPNSKKTDQGGIEHLLD